MQSPGPESWHPNPAFLFQDGAGPLFDIGPVLSHDPLQIFGAVAGGGRRLPVPGHRHRLRPEGRRGVRRRPCRRHVSAIAQFEGGESAQSIFSFDSPLQRAGFVEITGTEATIALPDPNMFDGDITLVALRRRGAGDHPDRRVESGRGTGVLDMARAIRAGVPHRATGELAYHVLDTMVSIAESIETGTLVDLESTAPAVPSCPRTGTRPPPPSGRPMIRTKPPPARRPLGVAMIGYAFMGKAHSNAWRNVGRYFDVPAFDGASSSAVTRRRRGRRASTAGPSPPPTGAR